MIEFRIGDVFDRLAEIPDGSIDLIVTSPPFLALRSYLPADHPDKAKEIGSEATPAAFLDVMLALTEEWGRVLAPHGSLCVELGDKYSGDGDGWPLSKSKAMLDTLYPACLAYGRNLLNPEYEVDPWRIRNLLVWARPNPTPGSLVDKFRPATSHITVACKGPDRWFDLDAVRGESKTTGGRTRGAGTGGAAEDNRGTLGPFTADTAAAGSPPLDWHADGHPEDGTWLWRMSTSGYDGAHYATFPLELPKKLILAMCPPKVCTECGKPAERITDIKHVPNRTTNGPQSEGRRSESPGFAVRADRVTETLGWTDCGHDSWRTGIVLVIRNMVLRERRDRVVEARVVRSEVTRRPLGELPR